MNQATKQRVLFVAFLMFAFSFALSLTGCGLQNQINDLKDRSNRNESDIDNLQTRVTALEASMRSSANQLDALNNALSDQGAALYAQVNLITNNVTALTTSGSATSQQVSALQAALLQAETDLSVLTGRVGAVEGDTAGLTVTVGGLNQSILDLAAYVDLLAQAGVNQFNLVGNAITNLENNATSVFYALQALQAQVAALQASSNSALVQIAVLQGYTNIVSIKDPCGAQGNVQNEVFLKLSSGKYLASFSDDATGKNTRFSVLADGAFKTTDSTSCFFTVSGGGTVISNEHN